MNLYKLFFDSKLLSLFLQRSFYIFLFQFPSVCLSLFQMLSIFFNNSFFLNDLSIQHFTQQKDMWNHISPHLKLSCYKSYVIRSVKGIFWTYLFLDRSTYLSPVQKNDIIIINNNWAIPDLLFLHFFISIQLCNRVDSK